MNLKKDVNDNHRSYAKYYELCGFKGSFIGFPIIIVKKLFFV